MIRSFRATLFAAMIAFAALPACASPGMAELYESTRELSEKRTNLRAALEGFPEPSTRGADLDTALAVSLAARLGPRREHAFVAPAAVTSDAVIRAAVAAIREWQEPRSHRLDKLERIWPSLDAATLTELKLAVERGHDRFTLHHLVAEDLESEEERDRFCARFAAPARELRAARGGPALTIVSTDVDDTVLANLWDRGRYARGEVYPGLCELERAQGRGRFLVVLTARPSLVAGRTRRKFIEAFGLEDVDPRDACISVAPGETLDILDSLDMGLHKAETLLLQRRIYPEAASVFNGDSGQGDWIAALILRHLDPVGLPYATIHDVRPWSREHAAELERQLASSAKLEAICRRALGLPAGALPKPEADRLARALEKIRGDVHQALEGPHGRLDGRFLSSRGIFLFRNHVELALDLAAARWIGDEDADRVILAALPKLRFLENDPFGFDEGEPERLRARLEARFGALR